MKKTRKVSFNTISMNTMNRILDEEDAERFKPKKEKKSKRPKKVAEFPKAVVYEMDVWKHADLSLCMENDLISGKKVSIDTETTGLLVWKGDGPWMISMADEECNSYCVKIPVDPWTREVKGLEFCGELDAEVEGNLNFVRHMAERSDLPKAFFNYKFDWRMLRQIGINVAGHIDEVSLQARVCNTDEFAYKLKYLSRKYCHLDNDEEELLKKGIQKLARMARKAGWMTFAEIETTNSDSKKDKSAPDYWLSMYAHLFLPEEEANRIKYLAEEYCRKDTIRTIKLDEYYMAQIDADKAFRVAYDREMAVLPRAISMEERGIRVHKRIAESEEKRCTKEAERLLNKMRHEVGDVDFNPASPQQLGDYLFMPKPKGLGLNPTERTATGQCKTGHKELEVYLGNEFVQDLFHYRALEKASSLFFRKYLDNLVWDENFDCWIIHPEINQGNTKTFRFSYSNPNLQQASSPESSSRGSEVIQVRNSFGPRKGYSWLLYDYSGQELRLLGGLMGIKEIIDAVKRGEDIPTTLGNETWGGRGNPAAVLQAIDSLELFHHKSSTKEVQELWNKYEIKDPAIYTRMDRSRIASQVLQDFDYKIVKLEKALGKKTIRTRTKMCLYGKAYGAGVKGVVGLLRCDPDDAKDWLNALDRRFPEMRKVANEWSRKAALDGYITNAYGRKLTVDSKFAYRSTNYRIQGTAADMMKISMLACDAFLKDTELDIHTILTVHDELDFEGLNEHCYKWVLKELKRIMEDHEEVVGIPMSVSVSKCTHSWDQETDLDAVLN